MSVLGIATIAKHKNLALSPLLTKAHFLVASEPVAKLDRLQKSLCMIKKKKITCPVSSYMPVCVTLSDFKTTKMYRRLVLEQAPGEASRPKD